MYTKLNKFFATLLLGGLLLQGCGSPTCKMVVPSGASDETSKPQPLPIQEDLLKCSADAGNILPIGSAYSGEFCVPSPHEVCVPFVAPTGYHAAHNATSQELPMQRKKDHRRRISHTEVARRESVKMEEKQLIDTWVIVKKQK